MSTKTLRERRVALNDQISEIVNKAESENRDLTTAENDSVENFLAEDSALKNRIARLEQNDSRAAELAAIIEPQSIGNRVHHAAGSIGDVGFNRQSHDASDLDRCVVAFARNASGMQARPDEWEAANRLGLLPNGAGLTVNLALNRPTIGREVSLLGEQNASMTKFSPKRGGVTVPAGFMQALEVALKAHGPMLNVSQIWITEDGRESLWPTIDDTGSMGEQIHESETVSQTELSFRAFRFGAFKFTSGLVRVSHELGRDSAVNLAAEIGSAFGIRLARRLNHDCTVGGSRGSGIRGILQDSVLGKESVGIQPDNIIHLITSLDGAYRASPDCAFMMHPQVFDAISTFKDLNGNYLIGDYQEGAVPRLRGYQVHFNPDMSPTADPGTKPIIFGDLAKYKLRIVGQIRFRQLLEKFADSDETGFVSFIEADGALLDAGTHPVKHLQIKSYEEE